MKYLIYVLLFSTGVFSQNYQYAIEEAKIETPVAPNGVNNQLEEIEYFKAYLLPLAKKATLQQALDTYGSVRLEQGDYNGTTIIMRSNQRLYGHPSLTRVPSIIIAAGSTKVHLENLFPGSGRPITLQAGGVISGCTFKTIKWTFLLGKNVMLENSSFINYGGHIQLDCSQSGYMRNNKIIKHQSGTVSDVLVMKGNPNTPSYGNVHLHNNYLTPHGNTTNISGLQSATFVGIDSEAWNLRGQGTKAMFHATNMGDVKITDFNGGNGYSQVRTPSFDIEANNVFFLNKDLNLPTDILSSKTNMFIVKGKGTYTRKSGTAKGFDLLANLNDSKSIVYNGVEQKTALTNSNVINTLSNTILGKKFTPWVRPNWETLPDPLGPNWKTNRIGKPDQTAYLQNLIDKNLVVNLPEGVFYISSTLKLPTEQARHGLTGQGTGKTVIVGLTDDFPLITLIGSKSIRIFLANLTLQGGSTGLYASQDFGQLNIAYQNMSYVIFRNQKYGIHLNKTGGFDNNFLENLSFIDCTIGFYQEPTVGNAGEDNSSYVDKTMFYKNQFLNCGTAISMLATRANNLNAWVDCKFDGGKIAINLRANNAPVIANCDFSNYSGTNVIRSNTISIYNSNIYNNKVTASTINSVSTNIEGCKFLDNVTMFSAIKSNPLTNNIVNSTITGNVLTNVPANQGFGLESAVYVNSTFLANPTLSKLLVNVKSGVPKVIINTTSNPYPQLLVTQ